MRPNNLHYDIANFYISSIGHPSLCDLYASFKSDIRSIPDAGFHARYRAKDSTSMEFTCQLKKGNNNHPQQRSTKLFSSYYKGTLQGTTKWLRYPTFWRRNIIFPSTLAGDVNFFRSTQSIQYPSVNWKLVEALFAAARGPPFFFQNNGAESSGLTSFAGYGNDRYHSRCSQCCHGWLWRGEVDKGHRNLEQSALGLEVWAQKTYRKVAHPFSFEIHSFLPRSESPMQSSSVVPSALANVASNIMLWLNCWRTSWLWWKFGQFFFTSL